MKRFLMSTLFIGLLSLSTAFQPLSALGSEKTGLPVVETTLVIDQTDSSGGVSSPVCDATIITQHTEAIKKIEKRNSLLRAGVCVCALAGASYGLFKLYLAKPAIKTVSFSNIPFLHRIALDNFQDAQALKKVIANEKSSFLSKLWFKKTAFSVRDTLITSLVAAKISSVGSYLKNTFIFDKPPVEEFYPRSTDFLRIMNDLNGYTEVLENPDYGEAYRSEIQDLIKERTMNLCASIEHIVAYMQVRSEDIPDGSGSAFDIAMTFLVDRANAAFELLWKFSSIKDKSSSELSRNIGLTLHIFERDFKQAVDRFDNAFYMATQA